ncbi:MAG: hypothetical protein PHD43_01145 [Methylococcales bacterium]|nr:hypothetical protein [Methylococcales bacterium]
MQLYYDQNEDRILLKLEAADKMVVSWLTRRQCLFLIQKGRESQSGRLKGSEKTTSNIQGKKKQAATKERISALAKYGEQATTAKKLKCAISNNAIKISFATDDSDANINLQLKNGDLQEFIDILMKLAVRANWGLTEALGRMETEKQNDKIKKTIH